MNIQDDPDHGPIAEAQRKIMNDLAKFLDVTFNPQTAPGLPKAKKKIGFFLTCFEFEDASGRFNYISNADKLDVKKMLLDIVARIEAREKMDAAGPTQGGMQ